MNRSSIEWTDYTWNPVTGCLHGCPYCYARRLADGRLKGRFGYENGFEPTIHPNRLDEPSRVSKPSQIFVCSMGDLMGDWVPARWIHQVIQAMWEAPQHTFQLLTKNPLRYREFKWPPNVWFGTSIDGNGSSMDRLAVMRDVELLNWGDAIRFVSFEPLLADVTAHPDFELDGLDWVIIGAQTGRGADPVNMDHVAALEYQAVGRRIPVFIKDNIIKQSGWHILPQMFPGALSMRRNESNGQ